MYLLGALGEYVRTRGGMKQKKHMHLDPFRESSCPPGLDFMVSLNGIQLYKIFLQVQVRKRGLC
jgi:hypothetical protein